MAKSITRLTVGPPMMVAPEEDRQSAFERAIDEALSILPMELDILRLKFDNLISAFIPVHGKIREMIGLCEILEQRFRTRVETYRQTNLEDDTLVADDFYQTSLALFYEWRWKLIYATWQSGLEDGGLSLDFIVKTFHWLNKNNHGYHRDSLRSSFCLVVRRQDISDDYMHSHQLHELNIPEAELDFCICEIYAHQPLIDLTIHSLREIVTRFKRLDPSTKKDLKFCCMFKWDDAHEMATENFEELEDSDIAMLADFSQLFGPLTKGFVVRIPTCMSQNMSWTMQAYLTISKRCAWFKEEGLQRDLLIAVYGTGITTLMEKYQRKTDDERDAFKNSLSEILQYSKPSIVHISEMICYAIHTFTSRLIFTFEEVRDIFGDEWIEEFQKNGTERMASFQREMTSFYKVRPDYPRNDSRKQPPSPKRRRPGYGARAPERRS